MIVDFPAPIFPSILTNSGGGDAQVSSGTLRIGTLECLRQKIKPEQGDRAKLETAYCNGFRESIFRLGWVALTEDFDVESKGSNPKNLSVSPVRRRSPTFSAGKFNLATCAGHRTVCAIAYAFIQSRYECYPFETSSFENWCWGG
jgi:hypothetical protein